MGFCCSHFEEFVSAMFDIHEGIGHQRHDDYIRLFERRGGQRQAPCSDTDKNGI